MTARRFACFPISSNVSILLALSLLLVAAPVRLRAQDSTQPEVGNSPFKWAGVVNSNAVYVRSGPSENDYATAKLDKGTELVIVGERFNWLKIVPPGNSFCYVAKAFVNRAGNGTIGQVTSTLNVRIGSSENSLKTKVATKLEPGQKVEIIGEQDEYFMIKPPADVYLYVSKQFVDPVRNLNTQVAAEQPRPQPAPGDTRAAAPLQTQTPTEGSPRAAEPAPQAPLTVTPATQPAEAVADATPKAAPTTQAVESAEVEFQQLEETYAQITQKPLDEQPVEELLAGYEKLAVADALPESLRRICDFKVSVLKNRVELKGQFVGARRVQEDMRQKQLALKAEQEELQQRVKDADIQFYTAVGTLRTSSLQVGQQTLYRLTDPANGRTVIYVRSEDNQLGQMIGQFVGIRGEVVDDAQLHLRVVVPASYENVNPSKVGQSVAAQIVPPSLLPKPGQVGTASTND